MFHSHSYEMRPRNGKRGFDLISDVLPFGRLWYDTPDHAIGYAMHRSRSHDAVIRVYRNARARGAISKSGFRCVSTATRTLLCPRPDR
jgi:hypothetical protein